MTPGFIVPRIQVLAMNEAADGGGGRGQRRRNRQGDPLRFRPRYAVLGLLEFIDWGGGDILTITPAAISRALPGSDRYRAPEVILATCATAASACAIGAGFLDYTGLDVDAYREQRLPRWSTS